MLKIRGFLPFISIVFINAFIDLGHKIVIQNAIFRSFDGPEQITMTAIVNGLLLLPFISFFTPAGFFADKYPKHNVLQITLFFCVLATGIITLAYYKGWFWVAFSMTFFLAMQSAFFSPAKFGYIKELVGRDLITKANAYVQSVTIGAILSGVFFYSVLFEYWVPSYQTELNMIISNLAGIGIILVFFALIQLGISLFLPLKREVDSLLRFDFKKYVSASYLKTNLFSLYTHKIIWVSSLGLMLFWAVNQVVFATFGAYLKEVSGVTNTVVAQGLLAVSGVGVVLGSIIAGYVSRKGIKLILIPIAAIGMSIGLFFLPMCQSVYIIGCLFFCYGVFGGLFVVTLESLIQLNTGEYSSGQILAGKNFIANVGMLVFLMITVCFSINNYSSVILFNSMCFVAVVGALFTIISYFKSSN